MFQAFALAEKRTGPVIIRGEAVNHGASPTQQSEAHQLYNDGTGERIAAQKSIPVRRCSWRLYFQVRVAVRMQTAHARLKPWPRPPAFVKAKLARGVLPRDGGDALSGNRGLYSRAKRMRRVMLHVTKIPKLP